MSRAPAASPRRSIRAGRSAGEASLARAREKLRPRWIVECDEADVGSARKSVYKRFLPSNVRSSAVDGPISAHEAQTKGSDDDSQFDARAADGLRRAARFQDQDVLKEMLALVYDAAIRSQFDQHIGAEPHERSSSRNDLRNGSRTRGLNTRAGSSIWRYRVLEIAIFDRRSSSTSGARNVPSYR
jgi:hypothetical protein